MASLPKKQLFLTTIIGVFIFESGGAFSSSKVTNRLYPSFVGYNQEKRINIKLLTSLMAEKRSGNPFQSFLGDMASSLVSNIGSANGDSSNTSVELDRKLSELVNLSSWGDIREQLESKQSKEEKDFRMNVDKGIGRASPLNKIRLYDETNKEEDIRVVFYRDSASWCPCKFFAILFLMTLLKSNKYGAIT